MQRGKNIPASSSIKKPFKLKYEKISSERARGESAEKWKTKFTRCSMNAYEIGWNLKSVLIMEMKIIPNLPHR